MELYEEENEAEMDFMKREAELQLQLDVMSKLVLEKLDRMEKRVNNELDSVENSSCALCGGLILITAIKLLVILLL